MTRLFHPHYRAGFPFNDAQPRPRNDDRRYRSDACCHRRRQLTAKCLIPVDVLTPEQRRKNMSRVRGSEHCAGDAFFAAAFYAAGLQLPTSRASALPGHPDMIFPQYKTAVLCKWLLLARP